MNKWSIIILIVPFFAFSQPYATAPGNAGSTAIHKDSSIIVDWANGCQVTRGYLNIQNASLGLVTHGTDSNGEGYADNNVVSLGDSGVAILSFPVVISNGPGPDFAIFENGFIDHYMEFAFVEVSSDGTNFFRFNAVSLEQTNTQLTNFSLSNCELINNLAGKYRVDYGVPFDLDELSGIGGLDINNITHVKLIDVIGSIDSSWGSYDSQNNLINDPFPTEFESGGFDLDGIAVINSNGLSIAEKNVDTKVFPNPFTSVLSIKRAGDFNFKICDLLGNVIFLGDERSSENINLSSIRSGIYYLSVSNSEPVKIVKQ